MNVLPTPNADGTDNGKVPIINGTQWELKTPTGGGASDFVITGSLTEAGGITLDKTFAQIQEAVQAGKSAVLKVEVYGIGFVLPLIGKSSSGYLFATAATILPGLIAQLTAGVGESENLFLNVKAVSYDLDGNLPQSFMDRDPEQAMEIATKQYVDTHAGGGTDMGITGAAVGQIAKITAVDASGVPTAWAPVDMPAGVPSVTAADNGKFLRVVNGAWAAAEISSANGVSF